MEYIAIEIAQGKHILSVFNTTKKILELYKRNNVIIDYTLKEPGKNYQVVDNKLVEK